MRVCYFGAFDPSYARNNFLRRSLELAGCEITLCNVPVTWPTYRKYPTLLRQYARVGRNCNVIVVAEFGQTIVPLAWALGKAAGVPVVFDHVAGLYEISVVERRRYRPNQFAAHKLHALDKYSGLLADGVLTSSTVYKAHLVGKFGLRGSKIYVAPLGVNDDVFVASPRPHIGDNKLVALYWGSFVPNHGVNVILDAIGLLATDFDIHFRFIGDGQGKNAAQAQATRHRLANVEFLPRIPFEQLPARIAMADIALGNFGDTPQARKSMTNKVLQGLAMKKAVITGDTPATREHFEHGRHLWLSPPDDAQALSEGLRTLARDPALRYRLAETGYQRTMECLTPRAVGPSLREYLERLTGERG